jgi:hypothetical protein
VLVPGGRFATGSQRQQRDAPHYDGQGQVDAIGASAHELTEKLMSANATKTCVVALLFIDGPSDAVLQKMPRR